MAALFLHEMKQNRKNLLIWSLAVGGLGFACILLYSGMTVKEVIRLAADMRKSDCRKESEALCERLQVDVNKKISELSLGNRKKVSMVCAMQHKPKLFIFDEPTSD